jgi:hypothetical protein
MYQELARIHWHHWHSSELVYNGQILKLSEFMPQTGLTRRLVRKSGENGWDGQMFTP